MDVLVVGGGPAGAAAALTLARAGRSVLLVHHAVRRPFQVGESLPPAAATLLDELGVLDTMAEDGHQPSYGVQSVWGSPHLRVTDFIRDPHGPGWRLDRPRFDQRLREAAVHAGAALVEGDEVTRVERDANGWRTTVAGQSVEAQWLVDATGRASGIARRLGGHRLNMDRLVGCVALFDQTEDQGQDKDAATLVEAVADGWWYTARLPHGRRVVVFHTDADLPAARQAAKPEGYQRLLGQTAQVQARLMGYQPILEPYVTAANSARLAPLMGAGWLAAGDAAGAFDPLSSQGILTALYLGVKSGEALAAQMRGAVAALEQYATHVEAIYTAYEERRLEYYRYERRWADRPFWRRRAV